MIDVRRLRTELDAVVAALGRRGVDESEVRRAADLDARQREAAAESERLRAEVKRLSRDVGAARKAGDTAKAEALADESRGIGDEQERLDKEATELAAGLRDVLLRLPNVAADDAPDGTGPEDNVVVRHGGRDADDFADHQRVAHWDVGADLGILDLERGAKLSGAMFVVYRGLGAHLVRALVQLGLDRNAAAYEEIRPPTLVRTDTMVSTGHLPKFEDDAYHVERDDLWAIPTAEVPLTSMARDEILAEAELPRRMMAHTSCFRREAGSAGRDTRGLLRVHEFDKVEVFAYSTPAQAADLHAEMLAGVESTMTDLGFAYRVLDLCAGDLGASSARTFDIEVYAPGVDQWLEVSSVSWFSDYQARRANIRYRPDGGKGTEIVHTLNGSALAVPRVWAALVETHRQPDGTVAIPEVLHPYFGGRDVIGR